MKRITPADHCPFRRLYPLNPGGLTRWLRHETRGSPRKSVVNPGFHHPGSGVCQPGGVAGDAGGSMGTSVDPERHMTRFGGATAWWPLLLGLTQPLDQRLGRIVQADLGGNFSVFLQDGSGRDVSHTQLRLTCLPYH